MTPYERSILDELLRNDPGDYVLNYLKIQIKGGLIKIFLLPGWAETSDAWRMRLKQRLGVTDWSSTDSSDKIYVEGMKPGELVVCDCLQCPIPKETCPPEESKPPRIEMKEAVERLEKHAGQYDLGLLREMWEMERYEISRASIRPDRVIQIWKARCNSNRNDELDTWLLLIVDDRGVHVENLSYAIERKAEVAPQAPPEESIPGGGKLSYYSKGYQMMCPFHKDGVEIPLKERGAISGRPPYLWCPTCGATGPLPVGMMYPKDEKVAK